MELWVRSQNKKILYKIDNINIDNNDYSLYYQLSWGQVELGKYKTKERALEVLDDIEYFISSKDIDGNRRYEFDVYQMPEE